jgi:hypothetical protein
MLLSQLLKCCCNNVSPLQVSRATVEESAAHVLNIFKQNSANGNLCYGTVVRVARECCSNICVSAGVAAIVCFADCAKSESVLKRLLGTSSCINSHTRPRFVDFPIYFHLI